MSDEYYQEVGTVPFHELVEVEQEDGTKSSAMFLSTHVADGTIGDTEFNVTAPVGGGMVISFDTGRGLEDRYIVRLEPFIRGAYEQLKKKPGFVFDLLAEAVPDREVRMKHASDKVCWFDITHEALWCSVEWRREQDRFGLHLHKESDAGFEGPDEIYDTLDDLIARLKELA